MSEFSSLLLRFLPAHRPVSMPKSKPKRRSTTTARRAAGSSTATVRRSARSSTAASTAAAGSTSSQQLPPSPSTPADPQQVPTGGSLTELLELIRTQVRAELQAQQLVGQSTNATTTDATATPTTAPGCAPRTAATNPEPSQLQGIYAIFISIPTYYVGRAGKHAPQTPRPVMGHCVPQPTHAPHACTYTYPTVVIPCPIYHLPSGTAWRTSPA